MKMSRLKSPAPVPYRRNRFHITIYGIHATSSMLLASSDAFGARTGPAVNLITYEQGVEPFRLTDRISSDKASLMGESLAKIYKWKPASGYSLT